MNGRSRLERYQNLRSGKSNETNVDEKTTVQKDQTGSRVGNYPNFRSGYSRQTSRSRLYQTSEYDSLLKEHEEFLKSLDEQFGVLDQSVFSTVETTEMKPESIQKTAHTTAAPHEYSQPVQQQSQPTQRVMAEQYVQQTYGQQMPQQEYVQQPYVQPVQQQYTQPTQRVMPEQYQQPYGQQMPQHEFMQQPYVQPIQQQYTQPTQRVMAEQYVQQPYIQPMTQDEFMQQPYVQPVQQQYTQPAGKEVSEQYIQQSVAVQQGYVQQPDTEYQSYGQPYIQPAVEKPVEEKIEIQNEFSQRTIVDPVSELEQPHFVYPDTSLEVEEIKEEIEVEEPAIIETVDQKIDDIVVFETQTDVPIAEKEETVKSFTIRMPKELIEKETYSDTVEEPETDEELIEETIDSQIVEELETDEKPEEVTDLYKFAQQSLLKLYPDLDVKKEESAEVTAIEVPEEIPAEETVKSFTIRMPKDLIEKETYSDTVEEQETDEEPEVISKPEMADEELIEETIDSQIVEELETDEKPEEVTDLYKFAQQSLLKLYPDLDVKKEESAEVTAIEVPEEIPAEETVKSFTIRMPKDLIEKETYSDTVEEQETDEETEVVSKAEIIEEGLDSDDELIKEAITYETEDEELEIIDELIDDVTEAEKAEEEPFTFSSEEEIEVEETESFDPISQEESIQFFAVIDDIEEVSEEEILEIEPIEEIEEMFADDAADSALEIQPTDETEDYGLTSVDEEITDIDVVIEPEIIEEAADLVKDTETVLEDVESEDKTQEIFIVDDTEDYFNAEKVDESLSVEEESITKEDLIKDLDLLDDDFDAKELDGKVIEIIDEEDSKKVIDKYMDEPQDLTEEIEIIEFLDDDYSAEDDLNIFEDDDLIDEILESQIPQYSDNNVFKFIDDILVDVKNDAEMIQSQSQKQDFFNVEEKKTVEDISRELSTWNLDELEFVDEESIMPTFDDQNISVVEEAVYEPANPVHTPVYYDDPVNVEELTQKLESERVLRQQMLEQTKQIKLQVREYEDELESVNTSMSKTNKILNFVLTLLIITLFVILFVIGFWFAQERGLI